MSKLKSEPVAASAELAPVAAKQVSLPYIAVGFFAFPKSTALAMASVDPDKAWSWRQDGPALKAAVEAAYDELRAQVEPLLIDFAGVGWPQVRLPHVKAVIAGVVRAWDDAFGWDAPNMSEMQEDAFYEFLVNQAVGGRFKNAL